jgi:hypothetical protein
MTILNQIQSLTENNVKAIITTRTVVKMNKKDVATKTEANPYVEVIKVAKQLVTLNPLYESAVNEELIAEGKEADFKAGERQWGENSGNGIVQNGDTFYVSYLWNENIDKTQYIADGNEVSYDVFARFVPVKKVSSTPDVGFRNVKVDNIIALEILA